jgi:hypothetical protein
MKNIYTWLTSGWFIVLCFGVSIIILFVRTPIGITDIFLSFIAGIVLGISVGLFFRRNILDDVEKRVATQRANELMWSIVFGLLLLSYYLYDGSSLLITLSPVFGLAFSTRIFVGKFDVPR